MNGALTILSNPAAGGGGSGALVERLLEEIPEARVVESDDPEGVRAVVAALELEESDTLAVLGGDGTIHQSVSGLFDACGRALPRMAVLPCGSGNALASSLGIRSEVEAMSALLEGKSRSIDVARLETDAGISHAINVIGWGLPARVTVRACAKRTARGMPYTRSALIELLFGDVSPLGVRVEGSAPAEDVLGLACLTPQAGGGMPVAPDALLDDGELDLVRVGPTSRLRLLGLFARLTRGKHLSARGVEHGRVSALRIEFDSPQPLVVDGETLTTKTLSIEVLAGALRVLVPR